MALWEVVLLAVVQGLTEFLPISSSGHLAIMEHWLRLPKGERLPVSVMVHFGTWVALLVYFRDDLLLMLRGIGAGDEKGRRLLWSVIIANAATVAVALPLKRFVEHALSAPIFVALFWVLTALLLFASEAWATHRERTNPSLASAGDTPDEPFPYWCALIVGLAQGLAAFPGLSRSGTTIAAGLLCGLGRKEAGRFAFLVGIPAILGANLVEAKDIAALPTGSIGIMLGVLVAFVVGYLAIGWTLAAVRRAKLHWFGVYCLLAALVVIVGWHGKWLALTPSFSHFVASAVSGR
jgi:undecaprenyl-diphosphatase